MHIRLIGHCLALLSILVLAGCRAAIETAPLVTPDAPVNATAQWTPSQVIAKAVPTRSAVEMDTPAPLSFAQNIQVQEGGFDLQLGSPSYIPAFPHLDEGCNWVGIAGQVLGADGSGLPGLAVLVTGAIDGQNIERAVVTAAESPYGPGGYEIFLSNQPPGRDKSVTMQLFTVNGQPLSQPVRVPAPASCEANLALVNFQSLYHQNIVYLPLLIHSK